MTILFLDFESYYDDEYSLRKLAPPNYILDPRFETIGCAVKVDDGPSTWVDGPDFGAWLSQFDPAECTTVTFNALFDNCILAWKYGFVPSRMYCSMRMAAALHGHKLSSVSLANVGAYLQVGSKGHAIIHAKGKRRSDLMADPYQWQSYKDYAINDNNMNAAIFDRLIPDFPDAERRVMDRVLRAAVEPRFMIDKDMLRKHLADMEAEHQATMQQVANQVGCPVEDVGSVLRSTAKFCELLSNYGVEIATKPSTSDPSKRIPALAKTDEFMADLLDNPDPFLSALASARLGVRSTIERTRGERILSIADLTWPNTVSGNMPMPLKYAAAHTHRLGGDWSINVQNLPAGRGGQVSKLRRALIAPPGHKVVTADLAQIECRISAHICGQEHLVRQFLNHEDPYAALAERIFQRPIDKNVDKVERFIGKTGVLGLGYGCGYMKFYNMVLQSARSMGIDLSRIGWDLRMAEHTVSVYRNLNSNIVGAWRQLDTVLGTAWIGASGAVKCGPVEVGHGYVMGPGGLKMLYVPQPPQQGPRGSDFRYRYGGREHHIYGAKFLENIVQFLARIVIMNAALRLWDRGLKFALQAHDELVFIVPDEQIDEAKRVIMEEMVRSPLWLEGLPLAAEVGVGASYGEAK